MIRLVGPGDDAQMIKAVNACPVVGPTVGMCWQMNRENPRLAYRFYLTDNGLFMAYGNQGFLCGTPATPEMGEELASFMEFGGIASLTAPRWSPNGWRVVEQNEVLVRPAAVLLPEESPLPGLDEYPLLDEVLEVLESSEKRFSSEEIREGFKVDGNIRRNHGSALIYGLRKNGRLVSTAGAYAIFGSTAYIACVETLPGERRHGYAAALVRHLCRQLAGATISLLCQPEQLPFYIKMGFEQSGIVSVLSENPATRAL